MDYPSNPGGGEEDMFHDGPPAPKEAEAKPESSTGILPKSILAGKDFKVGDEVVLKIVALHDNDVEVEYASEKGGEDEGGGYQEEMPAASPSNDMASMME